ncbi:MAG: tetratricopeptide repeat protein, partial [Rhodospirillaceae bacterium]
LTIASAAALAVLILAVFAPARHFDFVDLDDPTYVFENPYVTGGLTWTGITWAFTSLHAGFWIPAVWISYMIDIAVFGSGPGGHHITNLLLHTATALLLFLWFSRATGALARSWVLAALFALHPLRVESVVWITERKDVLSGLFWMLGLWAYLAYVRRPAWRRLAMVMAAFALALISKPMVVMFPIVLLLLDAWPLGRLAARTDAGARPAASRRPRNARKPAAGNAASAARAWWPLVREKLPLLAMSLAGGIVTVVAHLKNSAVFGLDELSLPNRVINALVAYFDYVRVTLWPVGLAAFYSLPGRMPPWRSSLAMLALVAVTVGVLREARRRPYLAVGWGWYLIALLPVSGLVQAGVQARADRFTYLPSIGLFLLATWGAAELFPRRRWREAALAATAVALVAACSLATRSQLWHWKDTMALWTRASMVELGLDEYAAHMQSGTVLQGKGKYAEARAHFEAAARLKPDSADPPVCIALTFAAEGRADQAIASYQQALRLAPDQPVVHNDLGALLEREGRIEEAIEHFRAALRLSPDLAVAHTNLALALVKLDRYPEAVQEFREALRLDPSNDLARRALEALASRQPGKR